MALFARKFGWVLVLTVLLLFLFPLQFGSFTQTHGPTTALRAFAAAQAVFAAMAMTVTIAISMIPLQWMTATDTPVKLTASDLSCFQMRC